MERAAEEFESFFQEVYPGLCRFVECVLAGAVSASAQDIAQETLLKLYREGLEKFPSGEARYWVFRVARNMALNELSRGRTRQRLFGRVVETFRRAGRDPEGDVEFKERRGIVLKMLKELPEHQRAALLLREQEGMSYREAADVLGVSESKVKADIFRARASLRERWARREESRKIAKESGEAHLNGLPKLVL